MRADALRQVKRRDPSFPLGTMEKGGTFYTEDEIRAWYQHRKRRQNSQVPPLS
ncbi:hypothetical protein [Streptomyces sp. NBC_00827]|uniref:hypothetical protein n=1 Tax=Streptomyces sp. NBC_00827 TaxID=2903677 RepID=UPI00386CAEB8|nr:hypothetical protein OG569_16680 [Streptomyces sp. NBC_00827]